MKADDVRELIERDHRATNRFFEAAKAFAGPRQRLLLLAEAASRVAEVLREGHAAGLVTRPDRDAARWLPPWEVRRGGPRVPVVEWQGVDRAFDALIATLDDPNGDLLTRARAYETLASAALEVSEALGSELPELNSALAICTFCGRPDSEVRKLIVGHYAVICDECVATCVETLKNEIGEDWRPSSD